MTTAPLLPVRQNAKHDPLLLALEEFGQCPLFPDAAHSLHSLCSLQQCSAVGREAEGIVGNAGTQAVQVAARRSWAQEERPGYKIRDRGWGGRRQGLPGASSRSSPIGVLMGCSCPCSREGVKTLCRGFTLPGFVGVRSLR